LAVERVLKITSLVLILKVLTSISILKLNAILSQKVDMDKNQSNPYNTTI